MSIFTKFGYVTGSHLQSVCNLLTVQIDKNWLNRLDIRRTDNAYREKQILTRNIDELRVDRFAVVAAPEQELVQASKAEAELYETGDINW